MAADELHETYEGTPAPVIVVEDPALEEEIDASLELTAAEAIVNEERHEEVVECLNKLETTATRQVQLLESMASSQTESPLLLQVLKQQEEILAAMTELNRRSSTESRRSPSSHSTSESPAPPAPDSERTEPRTEEAPAAEEHPAPPPAPKKRRYQTI